MSDTIRTGEATLRALLDAGEQRLAVLLDRSQRLRAERDPETLLRLVTSAAVDFAKTRVCGVGITDDNGGFERLVSSDDATAAEAERLFAPRADHPARRAIESRGVVLDGSSLFVPIASPSHVYGCLALIDKIGAPAFSDVDTQLAATFGAQVGIVYENARLLARLQAQTEAFRVQEEQTEFAMTAARIGVSYRDVGSSWVVMSKSLARLLGVPEDAGGMSQDELYTRTHPDDRARVRAAVEKAVGERSDFALSLRMLLPDGATDGPRSSATRDSRSNALTMASSDAMSRRSSRPLAGPRPSRSSCCRSAAAM